jgi:hypothetical protein
MKNKIYLFIPALIIVASYLIVNVQDKTIIPVDIFKITPELYQPGNGLLVHNHYLLDYAKLYLPWKFYLAEGHPLKCVTETEGPFHIKNVSGVIFPGGYCYPLSAVRSYTQFDSVYFFSPFTSFFTAYNLSYLFATVFFYFSFCFFFWCFFYSESEIDSQGYFLISLLSALTATCFTFARDLQSDGLSQCMPYVAVGLGFVKLSFKKSKFFVFGAGIFLFLGIIRSSLQALGFCPLFFFLFASLWIFREELKQKSVIALNLLSIGLATGFGVLFNISSLDIFLSRIHKFVPTTAVSAPLAAGKKIIVLGFSILQFLFGDLISSFSTIDFSKALGSLGARDYLSYDWTTFFINPLVSLFFILALFSTRENRKRILMLLLPVFSIDIIVLLLPTYRILYFRFHQWWLITNFLYVMGIFVRERGFAFSSRRSIIKVMGLFLVIILGLYLLVSINQDQLIARLGRGGMLGFEPGYWDVHVHNLLRLLSFRSSYPWIFVLSFSSLFFINRNLKAGALVLVTLSGLLLNTFFINFPQSTQPFYDYQRALKEKSPISSRGMSFEDNVKLFVNEKPCTFYESLEIPIECK